MRHDVDVRLAAIAAELERRRLEQEWPVDPLSASLFTFEDEMAALAAFAVNPADVDQNVVTLLNGGICTSADFERLLKDADNSTMQRLILSHIEKTTTSPDVDPAERRALNVLLHDGQGSMGGAMLENFDALGGVFHRCLRNPSMIPRWDDLTADAIENF